MRRVQNLLPDLLAAREMTWAELRRRTLLPPGVVARLRRRDANPPLATAERVAAALGVAVEEVWRWPEP
jgi:hypothetical protein